MHPPWVGFESEVGSGREEGGKSGFLTGTCTDGGSPTGGNVLSGCTGPYRVRPAYGAPSRFPLGLWVHTGPGGQRPGRGVQVQTEGWRKAALPG